MLTPTPATAHVALADRAAARPTIAPVTASSIPMRLRDALAEVLVAPQPATVWATPEGVPERFVWQSRRFVVVSRPIPWIDRRDWWTGEQSVSRGTAGRVLEQRMWQVEASDEEGAIRIYDLAVGETADRWFLARSYD